VVLEEVYGGGSTLTVALVFDRMLYIAHVGDSRLYLINSDAKVELLTHDHTLVQRLVDLGQISPEEAELHPNKNVLFRALGQADGFKADIASRELKDASILMLCSDGLWGVLQDKKIFSEIRSGKSLDARAKALVEMANEAGGPDNISVILVEIS
jgi:protein phosphatase